MSDLQKRFDSVMDPMVKGILVKFDSWLGPIASPRHVYETAVRTICELAEESELTNDLSISFIGAYCWAIKAKTYTGLPRLRQWPLAFFALEQDIQRLRGPEPSWALMFLAGDYVIGPNYFASREAAKVEFKNIVTKQGAEPELLTSGNYVAWKEIDGCQRLIATIFPL